jgi:hypothetical protein
MERVIAVSDGVVMTTREFGRVRTIYYGVTATLRVGEVLEAPPLHSRSDVIDACPLPIVVDGANSDTPAGKGTA